MKMNWLLVAMLVVLPFIGKTQESEFNKHSFGVEYEFFQGNPNLGLTYRHFKEGGKYNFKGSIFFGGDNVGIDFKEKETDLFYRTNDSATPIIGVNNSPYNFGSNQRIELGVERVIELKKMDLITGLGIMVGHQSNTRFTEIYEAEEIAVTQNNQTYFQLVNKDRENFESLNSLTSRFNYLNLGLVANVGFKFDLSTNFYLTTMLTMRGAVQTGIAQKNDFHNDSYLEHFQIPESISVFNFDSGFNIGIHYKF